MLKPLLKNSYESSNGVRSVSQQEVILIEQRTRKVAAQFKRAVRDMGEFLEIMQTLNSTTNPGQPKAAN